MSAQKGGVKVARPTKSAKVLHECSQTKAEMAHRVKVENKLKGGTDNLTPPKYLTKNQKQLFEYIREALTNVELLGNLDVWILTTCVIAIDRLATIEEQINNNPELLSDKNLLAAKDKYTKDFFRCCNELSLSPQSRAKLANIDLQQQQKQANPVFSLIKGGKK